MSRRLLRTALLGVVLAGALVAGLLLSASGSGPSTLQRFSLPRLGGGPPVAYPTTGEGAHAPTVLTFFASWCTPCQTELPAVARVAAQVRSTGGRVRFVGIDGNDDPASGLAFARRSGVGFPAGSDGSERVARTLSLPGLPDTVFVDASGRVVHVVEGPIAVGTLRSWLSRLEASAPTA